MNSTSAALRERLVAYAWNAWSTLGVAGWKAETLHVCIDVDALVLLTGRLGDTDSRLRDESIDWCASNLALVSRSRLAHLRPDDTTEVGWSAYAATLQRITKQRWPGAGTGFEWEASRKSRTPVRAEGATLALRCRALFGATARGELVRILLMEEGDRALDARELTVEAAYTKRSVAEALDHLQLAGLVAASTVGNARRFRFHKRREVEALLGPIPRVRTSQRAFCRVLWEILRASELLHGASERVQRVEAARIAAEFGPDIQRVRSGAFGDGEAPPTMHDLVAWAIGECDAHADSRPSRRK